MFAVNQVAVRAVWQSVVAKNDFESLPGKDILRLLPRRGYGDIRVQRLKRSRAAKSRRGTMIVLVGCESFY